MAHTEGCVNGAPATFFFDNGDENDERRLSWTEGHKICGYRLGDLHKLEHLPTNALCQIPTLHGSMYLQRTS